MIGGLHEIQSLQKNCDSIQDLVIFIMIAFTAQTQCLQNYTGTSAFADVSHFMADVEAKIFV